MVIASVKTEQRVDVGPNDGELVRRCRTGDPEAFQELVAKYYQKVYMLVLGILHDHEDALEVAQEVFCKAYKSIQGFHGGSAFYTWLYRIAVNQGIDYHRRQRREARELRDSVSGALDPCGDQGKDPYDALEIKERMNRLIEALEVLTPEHKAVIVLRAVEGLSYKEISSILGCSEGTVMSRLHYARKKLQEKLGPLL